MGPRYVDNIFEVNLRVRVWNLNPVIYDSKLERLADVILLRHGSAQTNPWVNKNAYNVTLLLLFKFEI